MVSFESTNHVAVNHEIGGKEKDLFVAVVTTSRKRAMEANLSDKTTIPAHENMIIVVVKSYSSLNTQEHVFVLKNQTKIDVFPFNIVDHMKKSNVRMSM